MKEDDLSRGKRNWLKLKNIIRSGTLAHKHKDKKFALFLKESEVSQGKLVTTYALKDYRFVQATPQPLYKELLHFSSQIDATGKWVWEAEEIAAYYLIHQFKRMLQKIQISLEKQTEQSIRILQLGAGCSGLAAITLSKLLKAASSHLNLEVLITDGQKQNIQYLQLNMKLNDLQGKNQSACHMLWGDEAALLNLQAETANRKVYDLILVCDCLYFTQFHKSLLLSIESYLSPKGVVLFVNPSRGDSMVQFLSLATHQNFEYQLMAFEEAHFQSEIARLMGSASVNIEKDIPNFIQMRRRPAKAEQA